MKDIDFDELDRAVNSLISPLSSGSTDTKTPVVANSTNASTPDTEPPVSVPARTSGRFMDVVHPSSDMRSGPSVQPRESSPREGTTITPPLTITPEEPVEKVPENEPDQEPTDQSQPLESPFLPDTKVEKRPLGAFSPDAPESSSEVADTTSTEEGEPNDKSDEQSKHPIETDTPMPAELQSDLLSIEANEDSAPATPEPSSAKVEPAPQTLVTPTSITKQYTEQPSSGDQPVSAIFNTDAYKKPMGSKKKKSGVLVILWIFLLLVVGAGVGAAVYFFVLPRL